MHVEGKGAGFRVQGSDSVKNPSSLIRRLSSFTVRTPIADVASAGGEIGIEVQRSKVCRICVFNGHTELWFKAGGAEPARFARLAESQSIQIEQIGSKRRVEPVTGTDFAASFARRVLRPAYGRTAWLEQQLVGISLRSINADITEGRLFAVGSGEDLEIAPAPARNETAPAGRSGPDGAPRKSAPFRSIVSHGLWRRDIYVSPHV
jgi:hypothetical protein